MHRRWNRTHPVRGFQKFCYWLWNVHWLYHRSYYIDEEFCFSSKPSQGIIRRVFTIKDSLAQLNELKHDPWRVLNFAGSVLSWFSWVQCHRAFVGISWAQIFFSWVIHGSQISSCGCLLGLNFFFVGVSWFQNVFLVDISWVQNFFSWVFRGSQIFS